ncbi:cupin domain-containing protein [Candidatus Palauibacter sp.]|uniref:cupin domain-containing protein n=1 Tax=Candidatus Palauibacter sp. TaxID=3101350 RepID=UPI003AF300C5
MERHTEQAGGREQAGLGEPTIVDKPWGREVWYAHTGRYAGKILEVEKGHVLSLQKHLVKHETMLLQSGRMRFTLNDEVFEWAPGEVISIPPGNVHRMEALEDSVILEVSTPELDDLVRLEDRYGRAP